MELAGCYNCPTLPSYRRSICHHAEDGRITVEDTLEFSQPESCREVFVSSQPIRLEEGRALFSSSRAQAELVFPAGLTPRLLTEHYADHKTGQPTAAYVLHLDAQPALRHAFSLVIRGI